MLKVVLIEDDINHMDMLTDALRCMVYPCASGDDVGVVLAGELRPDAVITDLRGCGSGTPREYLTRLRATVDRFVGVMCPIIVVSAMDPAEVEKIRCGLQNVYAVPKPWSPAGLRGALAAATESKLV